MLNEEQNKEPKDDWRLQKIELEFQTYGEHKGKYVGKIRFQNGEFESFDFKNNSLYLLTSQANSTTNQSQIILKDGVTLMQSTSDEIFTSLFVD
jgi:hypothetical protein